MPTMPNATPQLELWDRQAEEPNLWFSRFEGYRLAGPSRSLLGTVNAEQANKGKQRQTWIPGAWSRAFVRWRWRERAEAWDDHERQKAREAHAKGVEEMNQRQIQEGQAFQSKGIQGLKSVDAEKMSPSDALRYVTEGTKLERTARGEPESIEERRLTGQGGGAIRFSLEDAVKADEELERWQHDRVQPAGDGTVPEGNQEVP